MPNYMNGSDRYKDSTINAYAKMKEDCWGDYPAQMVKERFGKMPKEWRFSGYEDKNRGKPLFGMSAIGQIDQMALFLRALEISGRFTGFLYDPDGKSVVQLIGTNIIFSIHPQGECEDCPKYLEKVCHYSIEHCETIGETLQADFFVTRNHTVVRWEYENS